MASSSPWSYSDIYEQASSVPSYEAASANVAAYAKRYGSTYNLYLDGPHPRLLKGFEVSYEKVKIVAPESIDDYNVRRAESTETGTDEY